MKKSLALNLNKLKVLSTPQTAAVAGGTKPRAP